MRRETKLVHADACRRHRDGGWTPEAVVRRIATLTAPAGSYGQGGEAHVSVPRLRFLEVRDERRQTINGVAVALVGRVVGDPSAGRSAYACGARPGDGLARERWA